MSSKEPEDNPGTEDETHHKKRSRRVSFAETTAIHFFNRDDDCDTPPADEPKLARTASDEVRQLLESSSSSSSSDDEPEAGGAYGDDDDVGSAKRLFLRPVDSSASPGSCFGSATSNDEDNFFGPVSADFIRPGRFSDSAVSDENHDVTMDSTAFSMHFQSLMRSESGGEFKTPTGGRLAVGETPSAASLEDFMVLTAAGKQFSHSSFPVGKVADSGNSDDMSVVGENSRRYDYGKLPPELDVLLAEGSKDVEAVSILTSTIGKGTSCALEHNRHELLDLSDVGIFLVTDLQRTSGDTIFADSTNITRGNDYISETTPGVKTPSRSIDMDDNQVSRSPSDNLNQAPISLTNAVLLNEAKGRKDAAATSGEFKSPPASAQLNVDHDQLTTGSISSLLAKRKRIFRDSDNSLNDKLGPTLIDKELYEKGTNKRVWSTSSFAKSVSRLKRLEGLPFLSASKAEGNASSLMVSRPMIKSNNLDSGGKNGSSKGLDALVACLDFQLSDAGNYDRKARIASKMDSDGSGNSGDTEHTSSKKKVGEHAVLPGLHMTLRSRDKSVKSRASMVSPLTTSLGESLENVKSIDNHELELEQDATSAPQSMRNDCSLSDMMPGDFEDGSDSSMSAFDVSFPGVRGDGKVSASPLYRGCLSVLMDHHDLSSNLDGGVKQNADDVASEAKNASTLPIEKKAEFNLSSSDVNNVIDISKEKFLLENQCLYPITSTSSQTDLIHKVSEAGKTVSVMDGCTTLARILPAHSKESGSTPCSDMGTTELPIEVISSPKEKLSFSLLQKEPCDLSDDTNMLSSNGERDVSSRNLFDEAKVHNDDLALSLHEHRLFKDQKHYEGKSDVSNDIGRDSTVKDWSTVFTSFCGVADQLLSSATEKFDLAQIGVLNDALVHLAKMRSYGLLHSQIGSEIAFDSEPFLHSKRVADTKSLLHSIAYEKAKLQLLRCKRDKLLDQNHQMKYRVEESKKLMSSCQHLCRRGQSNFQVDSLLPEPCSIDVGNKTMVAAEISSLKAELDDSNEEVRKLTKSFHTYITASEELTINETVARIKDLVKRRATCQSLLADSQLCEVQSLKAMQGQPDILFDYGGFISQRYVVKSSDLVVSNALNSVKISKKQIIPDLNANSAFSFVITDEGHLTYEGLKTITQVTQKTCSLLHILLDVIEEVELAVVELRNLTQSKFCQLSAEKLDLQLHFTDFSSGARVTLRLDITCLKWGIYPSQVLPYEVQGWAARKDDSINLLVAGINTAVRDVKGGYMRIVSICRSVAKIIQAHGMS